MRITSKTFLKALDTFACDPLVAKSYLSDKRLTNSEKNILESFFLIRDNKFLEVINSLTNLQTENPFVESQRAYALGSAYNNKGEPLKALEWFVASLKLLEPLNLRKREFAVRYNLFLLYFNLRHTEKLSEALHGLELMQAETAFEKISIWSCRFAVDFTFGRVDEARTTLDNLAHLKSEMSEVQKVNYCIDCFDFGILSQDFKLSNQALEDMKSFRKFRVSANFSFMRSLLNHLENDEPLYLYENEFKEYPMLFYQVMVLKHLSSDEKEQATPYWQKLMDLNPQSFLPDFKYQGPVCVFSACLEKHSREKMMIEIDAENKLELLEKILLTSQGPVSKETIFKALYGKLPESKDDFNKLQRLVSIIRKKSAYKIIYKQGCYKKAS